MAYFCGGIRHRHFFMRMKKLFHALEKVTETEIETENALMTSKKTYGTIAENTSPAIL